MASRLDLGTFRLKFVVEVCVGRKMSDLDQVLSTPILSIKNSKVVSVEYFFPTSV